MQSDKQGNFTYLGPNGKRLPDLVWCSLSGIDSILDFLVEVKLTGSHHLPLQIILNVLYTNHEQSRFSNFLNPTSNKIIWNERKSKQFFDFMKYSGSVDE